jgi:hypothetical protein
MREAGCAVVVTLGGDGTNRAVALGWPDAPLVPLSTGTNNVFPRLMEGTIAGLAAGAVASGRLDLSAAARPTLCLEVLRNGRPVDLALVDVAVCSERFVGARAVWEPAAIRQIVSTTARSDMIGLSAIGAYLPGVHLGPDEGLVLQMGAGGERVLAPIAPGLVRPIDVAAHRRLALGEVVEVGSSTHGVLALDGERELPLRPGERVQVRLSERGPRVIDVPAALRQAVERGLFDTANTHQREHQASSRGLRRSGGTHT